MDRKKLSAKQKAFCEEYIIDLNGTQAAIRAGYSEKTANQQAARLLANVNIQAYIQELLQKRSNRLEITADNVLKEIAKLAFSDIREVFTEQGGLINPNQLGDNIAAAVQSIDVVENVVKDEDGNAQVEYTKKIKLSDKRASLELLAKHLGLLTEKVSIAKTVTILDYTGEDEDEDEDDEEPEPDAV